MTDNNKRLKLIDELDTLMKDLTKLQNSEEELKNKILLKMEEIYECDDSYVKVFCPTCSGNGFINKEDKNKKVICELCNGRGYIWMKIYAKK